MPPLSQTVYNSEVSLLSCGQEGPGQEDDEEKAHHVPRCPDPQMSKTWNDLLDSLVSWLQAWDTDPTLSQVILHFLWNILRQTNRPPALPPRYNRHMESQAVIGAQGLLEGCLSHHFCHLQQEHFVTIGRRCSAEKWARNLSQQLILVRHSMWSCRNEIKHLEESHQNRLLSLQVNGGIAKQFALGMENLPRSLRSYFQEGKQQILEKLLSERKAWLSSVSLERKAVDRVLTPQRAMMTRHFCSHAM